jgi:hypothetical protein
MVCNVGYSLIVPGGDLRYIRIVKPRNKLRQVRPSSQAVPQQLLDVLNEHIPGFRDEKYVFEIAWMLWCRTDPGRVHRSSHEAVWFHTDEIRRLFGEVKIF